MEEFLEQVATLGRIPEPELGEVLLLSILSYWMCNGLRVTSPPPAWHDACTQASPDSQATWSVHAAAD